MMRAGRQRAPTLLQAAVAASFFPTFHLCVSPLPQP